MPNWLKQLFSYVVSFALYAWLLSPKVALVLTGAIAFHECGHLYAAKRMGLRTKGFWLIPLVGGASIIADRYKKYTQMSFVVLAGPLAGAALAAVFYLLYLITGSAFIGLSAYWMAVLNLFNLLPMVMLDGGQFVEAILYSINDLVASIFMTISYTVAAFVLWFLNPVLSALVIIVGLPVLLSTWRKYKYKKQGLDYLLVPSPDKMNTKQIVVSLIGYLTIAAILGVIVYLSSSNSLQLHQLLSK